jgi:hypothetical protein
MLAGLGMNPSPGYNSPQSYQTLSEQNLNNFGGINNQQAGLGAGEISYGQGQMSTWGNQGNAQYAGMAGLAAKAPSWYADQAAVNSNESFDESKGVQDRALSRMGINPNSGRFVGLQTQWGLARAAAEAGARTNAQRQAEATQFQRQGELLNEANQGVNRGIGMMERGGGELGAARTGYGALAAQYGGDESQHGGLSGELAQEQGVKQAEQTNASQRQIDQMIQEMADMKTTAPNLTPTNYNYDPYMTSRM